MLYLFLIATIQTAGARATAQARLRLGLSETLAVLAFSGLVLAKMLQ